MGVAVVTGSESGIGRATAVALAGAGFDVGLTHRDDTAGAEATAAEVRGQGRAMIPAGRPGDAREIAAAIAFVATEAASYVTGHSFVVDGGMLLMAAEANRRTG
jgi:NAD(P)-dependent dehydrogenase (short-subunit alcohol dehydrogenase family)